ncbi:hypothetical protein GW7_16347 [Heterocephalus glaber]|uniref:Uncharacterized protein n=1 Tax=Heterocephalus glaber TaxID=10181 RepID=G5BQG4_HETGA|nr:hypothetical protein GW7_16347 [Heterocephalus glaber]
MQGLKKWNVMGTLACVQGEAPYPTNRRLLLEDEDSNDPATNYRYSNCTGPHHF